MAEEKKGAREKVKVGGKGSPDGWASEQERERLRRRERANGIENKERERSRERENKTQNGEEKRVVREVSNA